MDVEYVSCAKDSSRMNHGYLDIIVYFIRSIARTTKRIMCAPNSATRIKSTNHAFWTNHRWGGRQFDSSRTIREWEIYAFDSCQLETVGNRWKTRTYDPCLVNDSWEVCALDLYHESGGWEICMHVSCPLNGGYEILALDMPYDSQVRNESEVVLVRIVQFGPLNHSNIDGA